MNFRVTGLSSPPSIFLIRPFSTVTSSVQASGQSSGQAVRTVEWPHRSGGAVRAIGHYRIRRPWVTLPGHGGNRMADLTGRMIGAMQADVKTFEEIEADPNAMTQAITVIVIAGVASLIGNFFRSGLAAGVAGLVGSLVGYALFSFLVFLIGTKLMPEPSTKADFSEAFRTIGFAAAPGVFGVLAIVPFVGPLIGFVIGIWSLVIG